MMFYYVEGGALVCDEPIPGITENMAVHRLWDSSWYGGHQFFIAESMHKEAARLIARALGGVLCETNVPPSRQLVGATINIDLELTRHAFYGEHPRKAAA